MTFKDLQTNLKAFFEVSLPTYFTSGFTLVSESPLERVNEDAFCFYLEKRTYSKGVWSAILSFDIQVREYDLETLIDEAVSFLQKEGNLGGNVSVCTLQSVQPFVDPEHPDTALVYIDCSVQFSLNYA